MRTVLVPMVMGLSLVAVSACSDESAAEPVTIMPIGDSLTERVGWSTYRCHLDAMLDEEGIEFDFVGSLTQPASAYTCPTEFDRDHEGVNGSSIRQRAETVTESVEQLQPDVALVLYGANDLDARPPDEVVDEYASFVAGMQEANHDITILVAQYPPCRSSSAWCEETWPAFNDAIASFDRLSTDDSSVIVVDMSSGFSLDLLHDSAHPTDAGYEEMARRWMAALRESGVL